MTQSTAMCEVDSASSETAPFCLFVAAAASLRVSYSGPWGTYARAICPTIVRARGVYRFRTIEKWPPMLIA